MNIQEAIDLAKLQDQEREPLSLKVPSTVKKTLQKISDENKVSLNTLVSSILDNFLNGTVSTNAFELYQEFKEVSDKITDIIETNNPSHGFNIGGFSFQSSVISHNHDYVITLVDRYKVLKSILGVKGWKYL